MIWGDFLVGHVLDFLLMLVLLTCSAFFSGSETAFFNLTRAQLHRMAHAGGSARLAATLMRRPRKMLNTLLLGNMLVNVAYAGMVALIVFEIRHRMSPWQTAAVSIVPLLVLILLGEVSPKMLAIVLKEHWAVVAAVPMSLIQRLLGPILWVIEHVLVWPLTTALTPRGDGGADITAEELSALLALSARRGIITRDASALLQEIIELTNIGVCDVMVPRVDMIAYDVDGPPAGLLKLFRQSHLRKLPVYERDTDHILGLVHAKKLLLNPKAALRDLVTAIPFVPEAANIERVLLQFRVTRTQMAIVVDEYGGTAGLVSLEDILEEIVGDIPDAEAALPTLTVERLSNTEYLIDGDLAVHEWADVFKIDLTGRRISTVGGFVTSLLGKIPSPQDTAEYRNLRFTVESMRRRRIGKLRVQLKEQP